MSKHSLGLGPFLDSLDRQLRVFTADELRRAVLAHAAGLPASKRAAFLAALSSPGPAAAEAEPLLADIENLLSRIRAGEFYDGWGWDQEIGAEHAFGDLSWVEEMDLLLGDVGDAFVAGNLGLAREGYGRLLHAIWDGEEAEMLSGREEDPTELLETDLLEAKARYLRALYETTLPAERATGLLKELQRFQWAGPRLSLQQLRQTRREELPGLDDFLRDWIALLSSETLTGQTRELLSEAVFMRQGASGLAELARQQGIPHPEFYLELVRHLEDERGPAAAAAAAREAITAPVPPGEVRAQIADHLAALAGRLGDPAEALQARREAWRARATSARLLDLFAAAREAGQVSEVLEAESAQLPAPSPRCWPPAVDERLGCALLILAGQVDSAVERLGRVGPGWDSSGHPGYVVVPCLLLAAIAKSAAALQRNSVLARSLDAIDGPDAAPLAIGPGANLEAWNEDTEQAPARRLGSLLRRQVPGIAATPHQRDAWLGTAQALTQESAAEVVGATRRNSYELVARLVAACDEALALSAGRGGDFVALLRRRYPRHAAFRRELERARQGSPYLPDVLRGR